MAVLQEKYMTGSIEYLPASNKSASVIKLCGVEGFDVGKSFDCGQCFRFEPVKETVHKIEYAGVAGGRFFSVAQDGDSLYFYNCTPDFYDSFLCRYLALDTDYVEIRRDLSSRKLGEYMERAIERGKGIHILRQNRWEALCSFIISQNNNIPRIKGLVRALSARCGERISESELLGMADHGATESEYAFPSPEAVFALGENELKTLKMGFRAKYIYDAAKKVSSGELDLDKVAELPCAACLDELMKVKGVGLKVASCTALFGMEKYDAFPVDVWIKRVLSEHFRADFTPSELGSYAGIAQQYMFYAARFDN